MAFDGVRVSLCFGLSLTVLITTHCAEAQEPSLGAAKAMLTARDYSGCIREIDALLEQRRGDQDVHVTRGLCLAGRGDYASAITDYSRALEFDPRSVQVLYYRGVARSQSGDSAGLDDFARAIAIDPSFAAAHGGSAAATRLLGDDARAFEYLGKAIQLDPQNAALWHARGCLLFDMRDWDEAAGDFMRAIELDPRGQALSRARLWLIEARGASSRGRQSLETFLERPDLTVGDWDRRILEFLLGRRSEEQLFAGTMDSEPLITAGRQVQANFYAGSARLLAGDRDGARRLFQAAVGSDRRSFSEHFSAAAELRQLAPQ